MEEYYLVHHGVLGMKWGVRRYQNADGSLTAAGRKHYGYVGEGHSSSGSGSGGSGKTAGGLATAGKDSKQVKLEKREAREKEKQLKKEQKTWDAKYNKNEDKYVELTEKWARENIDWTAMAKKMQNSSEPEKVEEDLVTLLTAKSLEFAVEDLGMRPGANSMKDLYDLYLEEK